MPRSYPETHVSHGKAVGYSLKQRDNDPTYFAYFRSSDGRRLERATNQTGKERAREAARALIDAEYAPLPSPPEQKVSWDETRSRLEARLKAGGNRRATVVYYLKLLSWVRTFYSVTDGPADISPGMAERYRDHLMSAPGRGGKIRSADTVSGTVNGLSALWAKWLTEELKITTGNPWRDVTPPKTNKPTVKWATDDQVDRFFEWLANRFGGWNLPTLFFRVKSQTGCRLEDLCSLTTGQLRAGTITFTSDTTKGRKTRTIPISADLFQAVTNVAGRRYVWEDYPTHLRDALTAKGWPSHRLKDDFSPIRMSAWVHTLFSDFNTDNPDQPPLTSHQFRKRAFTLAKLAGIDSRDAAIAFGCNPDTMNRHYVGVSEEQIAATVAQRLAGQLDRLSRPMPNVPAQQSPVPAG